MPSSHEDDLRRTIARAIDAAHIAWGDEWRPLKVAVAPGRIEILGSHTDYNGGPVLAAAIDRATVVISDGSDGLELLFADFPERPVASIDPANIEAIRSAPGSPSSHDFALGVIDRARSKHRSLAGGRIVVATSIPIGAGLSSSAALCVALTLLMNQEPSSGAELVYDAQAAENWTGVPCGTMDQSASVFGQVIRYEGPEGSVSISPELGAYCFVVVASRVDRTLGTSSYPTRVKECAEAVSMLESIWERPIGNLAGLDLEDLECIERAERSLLPPHLQARTRHIVTEIDRVGEGEVAMEARDWATFGAIMNASGASSAGDYNISHPKVEALVAVMRTVPGIVGARMMGGGEGGAALALLEIRALDDLGAALAEFFDDESMRTSVVPLAFAPGAHLLSADEIEFLIQ